MKEFWLPIIIAFAYFFSLCAAVYFCSKYISLVRERQWRQRVMVTGCVLYERGAYREEGDEILNAEYIGND